MNKNFLTFIIALFFIFGGSFASSIINVSVAVEPMDQIAITSISPLLGKPGDLISINGVNFKTVDQILIGQTEVMYESITMNKITIKIPAGSSGGQITIKTTNNGTATSRESFVMEGSAGAGSNSSAPSITYFSPTEAKVGDVLTIRYNNLKDITGVYFGNIKTIPEENNQTNTLKVRVPEGATTSKISLRTSDNKNIVSGSDFKVIPASGSNPPPASNPNVANNPPPSTASNVQVNDSDAYTKGKGIVPKCNVTGEVNLDGSFKTPCDFKYFMLLINNLIKFLLFTIATPLIALILVYVGWLYMTDQGSKENLGKAKKILQNVVIGYIIALAAWLIVVAILKSLGYEGTIYLENY